MFYMPPWCLFGLSRAQTKETRKRIFPLFRVSVRVQTKFFYKKEGFGFDLNVLGLKKRVLGFEKRVLGFEKNGTPLKQKNKNPLKIP